MEIQSLIPILIAVGIAFVIYKVTKKIFGVALFIIFLVVVYALVARGLH